MKKYPYQNLELGDIKDEIWEDIPGLDGYFMISSYGRVKRLKYEMQYKNGKTYVRPEKIIKPQINEAFNYYKKDYRKYLCNKVQLNYKLYTFSLGRMVYHCFVNRRFDMDNYSLVIFYKDDDCFNITPSNLLLANLSDKQSRIFSRKRVKSQFDLFSKAFKNKIRKKISKTISRQVTQYTIEGKKIKTFSSLVNAQRATGVLGTGISHVARGKGISAGGFLWRWGNARQIDIQPVLEGINIMKRRRKIVTQYTMNGERVAVYPTIVKAGQATKTPLSGIGKVINKKAHSARGFYWMYGQGPKRIDLSGHEFGMNAAGKKHRKPVKQYSLQGKYLEIFESVKEAAAAVGLTSSALCGVLTGKYPTAGKYKWKYAKEK
jgi:hypothetical protein